MDGYKNLENLLNSKYGVGGNSNFQTRKPNYNLSLDTDEVTVATMAVTATSSDDFTAVVDVYARSAKLKFGIGMSALNAGLRDAHARYVAHQLSTAQVFAVAGEFDDVETHLRNAHIGAQIGSGLDMVVLEPSVSPEDVHQTMQIALEQTPIDYFVGKVGASVDEGDIDQTKKYIALTMQSLDAKKIINMQSMNPDDPANRNRHHWTKVMGTMLTKAYRVALGRKIEAATRQAIVGSGKWTQGSIDRMRIEAQDLMYAYVEDTVAPKDRIEAARSLTGFFNSTLHPIFEELSACAHDSKHPLRKMYRARYDVSTFDRVERVETSTELTVPETFASDAPRHVHPFYVSVVERYMAS